MQTILIAVHLVVVVALVGVVLLQRSEGGALGIGGGGGFMTGRSQANALTRATSILGALFFITSLGLTLLANLNRAPASRFDAAPGAAQPAPAGSVLDQLNQLGQPATPTAPASPLAPAAPSAPEPPRP